MKNLVSCLLLACSLLVLLAAPVRADSAALGEKLYQAAMFGDTAEITTLISQGANVNFMQNGRPILGWAAQGGSVETVNALLKAGANPNIADEGIGHTPLMRAIDTQQTAIVEALLKAKADPNAKSKEGKSCLMMAVESRKPEIVRMLIDAKADVKAVTPDGDSPVLSAAQDGMAESLEILKMLGKAGANMNASNAAYTPLVYALQQENKDLIRTLLESGADANARTSSGTLPLQVAVNSPEMVKMLLAAKADPNAVVGEHGSPLAEAITSNQPESAKLLLEAGAEKNKGAPIGSSMVELAKQYGMDDLVPLLGGGAGSAVQPTAIPVSVDNTAPTTDFNPNSDECTIVDAARKQMNLHDRLQKQVDAGKKTDDIFRTYSDDSQEFATLLTENPPAACKLLDTLAAKYGVSWK